MNPGRWQRDADTASSAVLQQFHAALRDAVSQVPVAPCAMAELLSQLEGWHAAGVRATALPEALSALQLQLFTAAGRDVAMGQMWRGALAASAAAWSLAQQGEGHAAEVSLGALLHRVGAARLMAIVARHEAASGKSLHASLRRQLELEHEAPLRDALLDAWKVPPVAAEAARAWRAAFDAGPTTGATTGSAQLVYLAQLLASEALQPLFCPPALADGVASRLRISAARLQAARAAVSLPG